MDEVWEIDHDRTEDHWLEVVSRDRLWGAHAKWDGCCHIDEFDLDGNAVDGMHICDLDEMIRILTALRRKAQSYFGDDWGT